jgi:hypothetical protein
MGGIAGSKLTVRDSLDMAMGQIRVLIESWLLNKSAQVELLSTGVIRAFVWGLLLRGGLRDSKIGGVMETAIANMTATNVSGIQYSLSLAI